MSGSLNAVQIVQDAGAILSNATPANVQYLFTNNLQSCIAVVAFGTHGVALVHDSGYTTKRSVENIFRKIGEIQFWSTAFNPNSDEEYFNNTPEAYLGKFGPFRRGAIYEARHKRITEILDRVIRNGAASKFRRPGAEANTQSTNSPGLMYYPAAGKWVAVSRQGEVSVGTGGYRIACIIDPNAFLRQRINEINHLCSAYDSGSPFGCHLQYDGVKFGKIPHLTRALDRFSEYPTPRAIQHGAILAQQYSGLVTARTDEVIEEHRANDATITLDTALRRAAHAEHVDAIRFLLDVKQVDVDAQGQRSGETALHVAARHRLHGIFKMLTEEYHARTDIQDHNGTVPIAPPPSTSNTS